MQLLTRKFTVDQYHQMAEQGILHCEENVELIEGEIISMSPIGFRHAFVTNYLANYFAQKLQDKTFVSVQNPISFSDRSEPQPDIALLKPSENFYSDRLPQATDILLLLEVADSSLTYDREVKIPLYAQHQINEIWLINLTQNQLERYTDPLNNRYQNQTIFYPNQKLTSLAFPELELSLDRLFN